MFKTFEKFPNLRFIISFKMYRQFVYKENSHKLTRIRGVAGPGCSAGTWGPGVR